MRSPGLGGTITHAAAASEVRPAPPASRSRAPLWIGLGVVALAAVSGGVLYAMRTPETPPPTAQVSNKSTEPSETEEPKKETEKTTEKTTAETEEKDPAPSVVHATIKISPPTAVVTVNGKPATVTDGAITIDGEPGDSFDIVAKAGDRQLAKQIVLRKDGKPSVDALEVPGAPPAFGKPLPPGKTDAGAAGTSTSTGANTGKPPGPPTASTTTSPPGTSTTPVGVSTF
jgi:hypothetical protein